MQITDEIIERLIRRELEKGEKGLVELYNAAMEGEITWEEFRKKSKALQGYGVWWGSELSCSLGKVEVNEVKELGEGLYEISAMCYMHYMSGHIVWGEGGELEEHAMKPKKAANKNEGKSQRRPRGGGIRLQVDLKWN
jgi:hypothetical protein